MQSSHMQYHITCDISHSVHLVSYKENYTFNLFIQSSTYAHRNHGLYKLLGSCRVVNADTEKLYHKWILNNLVWQVPIARWKQTSLFYNITVHNLMVSSFKSIYRWWWYVVTVNYLHRGKRLNQESPFMDILICNHGKAQSKLLKTLNIELDLGSNTTLLFLSTYRRPNKMC